MDLKDKVKISKNKTFLESLKHALTGIRTVMEEERNMKYHVSFGVFAIILSFIFKLNQMEWLFILLAIFFVLVTEIINTSFENLVDLVTDRTYHELAKKVKDMAAGAVLLSAVFASITGMIIFIPKIWHLFI